MTKNMTKKLHKVYEESMKIVEESMGTLNEFSEIDDTTEMEFYIAMHDFFMQQKQKEAIKRGIY